MRIRIAHMGFAVERSSDSGPNEKRAHRLVPGSPFINPSYEVFHAYQHSS